MKHALALLWLTACGGAALVPQDPTRVVELDEMRVVAGRQGDELVFDSYDAGELFARATEHLNDDQCREAVEVYERLVREFETSRYVSASLYNAGLCLQEAGELEAAAGFFERLLERGEEGTDARHAALQLTQALVGLEPWEHGLAVSERVLLREDLSTTERLEALARRAQALLGLSRLEDAARQAREAMTFYRTRRGDEVIDEPYFAAAANFVLAETLRLRSEAMAVPEADAPTQHQILDRRAALLLEAQREYFNTIRLTEPHWASAAGYRIGSMYETLWHALMSAPIPPPSRPLAAASLPVYREEYRAELGRHVRPLLRHAIRYWELTLMMAERTSAPSEWAERTRTDLERMRDLLLREEQGPPTPSQLLTPPGQTLPRVPEALLERPAVPPIAGPGPGRSASMGSRLTARSHQRT